MVWATRALKKRKHLYRTAGRFRKVMLYTRPDGACSRLAPWISSRIAAWVYAMLKTFKKSKLIRPPTNPCRDPAEPSIHYKPATFYAKSHTAAFSSEIFMALRAPQKGAWYEPAGTAPVARGPAEAAVGGLLHKRSDPRWQRLVHVHEALFLAALKKTCHGLLRLGGSFEFRA